MTIEEQLAQAERERDSFKRQLATLQDAILLALVQRIEPRMSRHPVTVVQHAGSIIARIGEAMDCQFEDGDDLVEAVKELVRERDEARAEVEQLRAVLDATSQELADIAAAPAEERTIALGMELAVARAEAERLRTELIRTGSRECDIPACNCGTWHHQSPLGAYRRGAEAMREACAREASVCANHRGEELADILSALPIPEEP